MMSCDVMCGWRHMAKVCAYVQALCHCDDVRAHHAAEAPGWAGWRRPPWCATSCVGWQRSCRAPRADHGWGGRTAPRSHSGKHRCLRVWSERIHRAPSGRRHTALSRRPGHHPRHSPRMRWPPVNNIDGEREEKHLDPQFTVFINSSSIPAPMLTCSLFNLSESTKP